MSERMMKLWIIPLAASAWCATVTTAAADDSVLLKPKFVAGRTIYIETRKKTEQTMSGGTFGDEGMSVKRDQILAVRRKIDKVTAAEVEMTLAFDRISQSFDGAMMGSMTYDSDAPAPDSDAEMLSEIFAPLVGKSFKLKLDAQRRVKSIDGLSKVIDEIADATVGNLLFDQLKQAFSDDSLKSTWGASLWALYPHKAVSAGDTWKNTLKTPSPQLGGLTYDFDCKLDRIDEKEGRKFAAVSFQGKIRQFGKATPNQMGLTILVRSGSFEGKATFDIERGELVERSEKTSMEMAGLLPGGEDEVAMTIKLKSTRVTRILTEEQRRKQKSEKRKKSDGQ